MVKRLRDNPRSLRTSRYVTEETDPAGILDIEVIARLYQQLEDVRVLYSHPAAGVKGHSESRSPHFEKKGLEWVTSRTD